MKYIFVEFDLNVFIYIIDSDIKVPVFEAFEIREDHSMTMASTRAKIGANIKEERLDTNNERFDKEFNYEIENKRLTNVNENYFRQENLPQNHVS